MTDQDDPDRSPQGASQAAEESAQAGYASHEQSTVYAGSPVQFNDSVIIFPDKPLPDYDRGPVKAFKAQGSGRVPEQIYALVCDPLYPARSSKAANYATVDNQCLPRLIATGPAYWPLAAQERYIFIYQHTTATRLIEKNSKNIALGWKPELVTNAVIKPLVGALIELRNKDIIHGALRPGNLYIQGNAKNIENIMLGDCLSLPVGFDMPAVSETVERAMADPIARGIGRPTDEMYSFGVMLALLLRTHDPMAGLDDDDLIRHKIEFGSFATLISKDRMSGSVLELLRGLLYDSHGQRWDLDDVEAWLEGERLTPKAAGKKIKASRPLNIGSKKYILPELIARESGNNPKGLVDAIDHDEMQQWLDRAVDDKALKDRYKQSYEMTQQGARDANYPDKLAARISIALHPRAPIRFKGLRVFPDGVGKALGYAMQTGENLKIYQELLQDFFVMQWVDMYGATEIDNNAMLNKFANCRSFLQQKLLSFGLERCVYHLSEETHCLSEKLNGYFVRNAEDMIRAFEKNSTNPNRPAYFFDKHSVAFLSVKDKQVIDRFLHELQSKEKFQLVLAELKILEAIQRNFRMEKFPGVASWVADNMEPVYERVHDRNKRTEIKEKIEQEKRGGSLSKMLSLFENERIFKQDFAGYRAAMQQYIMLNKESEQLADSIANDKSFGTGAGMVAAAITSCAIATIVILLTIIVDF